jgi:hypothetical protein
LLAFLEQLALTYLRRHRFPEMQRRGFSTAIRKREPHEFTPDVPIRIIPDGWFVEEHAVDADGFAVDDGPTATFTCIEIEDRHPLSPEELWHLWFAFDTLDLDLRLFVFDRCGLNEREIDLAETTFSKILWTSWSRKKPIRSNSSMLCGPT